MEVAKNRSGKTNGIGRNSTESGLRRVPKRSRSSALSVDFLRLREAAVNGGTTTVSGERHSPLDCYQESLAELERATERCEDLMKLLQEAFQQAKAKAIHCHRAYEQLCSEGSPSAT